MKIALGVDHAAFDYKSAMISVINELGYEVIDCGTYDNTAVDYPNIARQVAQEVIAGNATLGIFLCGTGIGGSIAANKVAGIRAALCHESYTAAMAREHNNANMLCIGARVVGKSLAKEIARTFLQTPYSNEERHQRRIHLLDEMDAAGK